jgi:hypothetical protein
VATLTVNSPASALGGYGQTVTNNVPIAYWRLNETNGATVAADFFGTYHGAIGAGVTTGIIGPRDPPFVGFETNNTAMQLNFATNSILTMPASRLTGPVWCSVAAVALRLALISVTMESTNCVTRGMASGSMSAPA